MKNILVIESVEKLYNSDSGIKNISLRATNKEVVCVIGPNGVGKTTLLNIIAGVDKPNNGVVKLNNKITFTSDIKSDIGYMPNICDNYASLKLKDLMIFVAEIKKVEESVLNDFLVRYDLFDYINRPIRTLSYGMKNKINLIIALIGQPKLLVLDEPTNGLDTKSVIYLKEDIMKHKNNGAIIIVSSHILDFVSQIGTRFCFLNNGVIFQEIVEEHSSDLERTYKSIYKL